MMFDKARYLTRGINEKLSIPLQITLWTMIEKLTLEKDYLQVFELSQAKDLHIRILHKQEVPPYSAELLVTGTISEKKLNVFVIDNGDYSTMLLAEEY